MKLVLKPIFVFLLLLLLCHTFFLTVCASGSTKSEKKTAELFNKEEKITDVLNNEGEKNGDLKNGITIKEINLPVFLVSPEKNVMMAVAEAKYTKTDNGDKNIVDVITQYFKADTDDEWKSKVMDVNKENWKTQLATKNSEDTNQFSKVMFTAVNAEKNKIYIFILNRTDGTNDENRCFKLIESLFNGKEKGKDKLITWNLKDLGFQNIVQEATKKIKEKTKIVLDKASGSVFFTKDKNILFILKCKTSNGGDGSSTNENVALLFYVDVENSGNKLTFLDAEITGDWYSSFFQLNEEIFKIPNTDKKDESNKIMVFTDTEKIFTTTNSSVARLWNFLKNKNNFATVTIKNHSLLLFTEEKEKDGNKKEVNLWMTDGTRASCVKTIITTNCKDTFYWSVLHANNELFALHNKYETERTTKNTYILTHLKEELSTITNILDRWMKNSNTINELCQNTATAVIPCLTDGLVGFLSGTDKEENGNWKDEYSFADATIKKKTGTQGRANKVQYGFTFSGSGEGAHWPVEKPSPENQLYNFTDPGFTLVATVIFNNNEEKDAHNSVLGVNMKINEQVGLWCNKEKKWTIKVKGVETLKENGEECLQGKMYSVAVVLREAKNLEIYINWKKLTGLNDEAIQIKKEDNIKYFYFGVDSDKENEAAAVSYVTVTNVMLYNRPFTGDEILDLKIKHDKIVLSKSNDAVKDSEHSNGDDDSGSTSEISLEESASLSEKITKQTNTEKNELEVQSSLRPRENAVSVNVGVFLVMFVVLFTLGGHYV